MVDRPFPIDQRIRLIGVQRRNLDGRHGRAVGAGQHNVGAIAAELEVGVQVRGIVRPVVAGAVHGDRLAGRERHVREPPAVEVVAAVGQIPSAQADRRVAGVRDFDIVVVLAVFIRREGRAGGHDFGHLHRVLHDGNPRAAAVARLAVHRDAVGLARRRADADRPFTVRAAAVDLIGLQLRRRDRVDDSAGRIHQHDGRTCGRNFERRVQFAAGIAAAVGIDQQIAAGRDLDVREAVDLGRVVVAHERIALERNGNIARIFQFNPIRKGSIGQHQRGLIRRHDLAQANLACGSHARIKARADAVRRRRKCRQSQHQRDRRAHRRPDHRASTAVLSPLLFRFCHFAPPGVVVHGHTYTSYTFHPPKKRPSSYILLKIL